MGGLVRDSAAMTLTSIQSSARGSYPVLWHASALVSRTRKHDNWCELFPGPDKEIRQDSFQMFTQQCWSSATNSEMLLYSGIPVAICLGVAIRLQYLPAHAAMAPTFAEVGSTRNDHSARRVTIGQGNRNPRSCILNTSSSDLGFRTHPVSLGLMRKKLQLGDNEQRQFVGLQVTETRIR